MILQNELTATPDEPTDSLTIGPTRLWMLALNLFNKLQTHAENNERILNPRTWRLSRTWIVISRNKRAARRQAEEKRRFPRMTTWRTRIRREARKLRLTGWSIASSSKLATCFPNFHYSIVSSLCGIRHQVFFSVVPVGFLLSNWSVLEYFSLFSFLSPFNYFLPYNFVNLL